MPKFDLRAVCSLGLLASAGLVAGCEQAASLKRSLRPHIYHSAQNNSPYSTLNEATIQIHPYDAKFDIPSDWLTAKRAPDDHVKNLFLSWDDLNQVDQIDHEPNGFDSEEADVINRALPFQDCVAQVGDRGWGNGLWNDLEGRVYITDLTPDEIGVRLRRDGLPVATTNFERASLSRSSYKDWEKYSFDILDAPEWSDFIHGERLDFYLRRTNDKTAVFMFLHTDAFESEISLLLNSFIFPAPPRE